MVHKSVTSTCTSQPPKVWCNAKPVLTGTHKSVTSSCTSQSPKVWCNAKPALTGTQVSHEYVHKSVTHSLVQRETCLNQGRNAGDLPHYVRTYKNISMIGRLSLEKCTSAKGKIPEGPWCVVVRNNRENKLALLALGCLNLARRRTRRQP